MITGEYQFEDDTLRYPHRRSIAWNATVPVTVEHVDTEIRSKLQRQRTIVPLTRAEFSQIKRVCKS